MSNERTQLDKPTKPVDCFTDEQKKWAVEKIKAELPDEWQRLVNRQAHNMEVYEPTDEERGHWALDALKQRKAIEALPFDFGDDGWEPSRTRVIDKALIHAALVEAKQKFLGEDDSNA